MNDFQAPALDLMRIYNNDKMKVQIANILKLHLFTAKSLS